MFMAMTPQYKANFEKGGEYVQFVIGMWPQVYPERKLTLMEGKANQLKGETKERIEIKFDDIMARTKRVYIETDEKSNELNSQYVRSGIYRSDNTTMYLVGDYERWFLFSKQKLQWLDKLNPPFLYRPEPTPTSIGFCIPIKNAVLLALDSQEFEETLWDARPRNT